MEPLVSKEQVYYFQSTAATSISWCGPGVRVVVELIKGVASTRERELKRGLGLRPAGRRPDRQAKIGNSETARIDNAAQRAQDH